MRVYDAVVTASPVASIGDENAGCAPAPLEQGAAPCRCSDTASNKSIPSISAFQKRRSACGRKPKELRQGLNVRGLFAEHGKPKQPPI
jgi:hypothetical protein